MSHENEGMNFNEISQYCHPMCILISSNIKKPDLILNDNHLEYNGENTVHVDYMVHVHNIM